MLAVIDRHGNLCVQQHQCKPGAHTATTAAAQPTPACTPPAAATSSAVAAPSPAWPAAFAPAAASCEFWHTCMAGTLTVENSMAPALERCCLWRSCASHGLIGMLKGLAEIPMRTNKASLVGSPAPERSSRSSVPQNGCFCAGDAGRMTGSWGGCPNL